MADQLTSLKTRDAVWDAAIAFLPDLGLSKIVFYDLSNAHDQVVRSNAGAHWTDVHSHAVKSRADPFAAHCLSRAGSVLTGVGHLSHHSYLDTVACDQIAQGSEMLDIRTGMSVTIQACPQGAGIGWNLMSISDAVEFDDLRVQHENDWRAWCQLTYACLSQSDGGMNCEVLSQRERDCLAYIADGLRTTQVAHRLGIVDATVEMHLRRARTKLGAKTRDHAVAIAIKERFI